MTTAPPPPSGWLPTPEELGRTPQLAIMVALDASLEMTACALQVAHPELARDEPPYQLFGPRLIVADELLSRVERLREALSCYRDLARAQRRPAYLRLYDPDDIPF
jgi:hypothetical protein